MCRRLSKCLFLHVCAPVSSSCTKVEKVGRSCLDLPLSADCRDHFGLWQHKRVGKEGPKEGCSAEAGMKGGRGGWPSQIRTPSGMPLHKISQIRDEDLPL